MSHEKTLILFKPDTIHRGLVGEIINRFERKGLKIVGLKMMNLNDEILAEHYSHHKDKDWFPLLRGFMQKSPIIAIVLEGLSAISIARNLTGPTKGYDALPGTIRGDYSISTRSNIIHASEDESTAKAEIQRFFNQNEIFDYKRIDFEVLYAEEER